MVYNIQTSDNLYFDVGLLSLSLLVIVAIIILVFKTGGDLEMEREMERSKQIKDLKIILIKQDDKLDLILAKIK